MDVSASLVINLTQFRALELATLWLELVCNSIVVVKGLISNLFKVNIYELGWLYVMGALI